MYGLQKVQNIASIAELISNNGIQDKAILPLLRSYSLSDDKELEDILLLRLLPSVILNSLDPNPYYPLPGTNDIYGPIRIGKIKENNAIFGLLPCELPCHTLCAGSTGSGKTNLIKIILAQTLGTQNIHSLIFSFNQEYRGLTRFPGYIIRWENLRLNPLQAEGIPPLLHLNLFSEIFAHSTGLLEASSGFVRECAYALYQYYGVFENSQKWPCLLDLYDLVMAKNYHALSRESRYREVVKNRLSGMHTTTGDLFNCSTGFPLEDFMQRDIILELDGLTREHQNFIINCLLNKIFAYKMSNPISRNNLNLIVLDEAQFIFSRALESNYMVGLPFIAQMVAQVRKFNIGLLISSQVPSQLMHSVLANMNTKLVFPLGDGADVKAVSASMGLNKDQRDYLYELQPGQAVVKLNSRYTKPFPIVTPLMNF